MVTSFRPYGIAYFPPAVHHCNEVKECGMQPKWQQGDAKIGKNSKYTKTRYNTVKSSEITATMTLQIPMIGGYIWQLSSLSESKKHHWHSFVKTDTLRTDCHNHSMARANLNKSEWLVTNTTEASKYISKTPRICINWNSPFSTSLHKTFKNCIIWNKSYFTTLTFRGIFTK